MTNHRRQRPYRWQAKAALAISLFVSGANTSGLELLVEGGWDGPFNRPWGGGPFVPGVGQAPIEQTQDGFVVAASGTAIQDTPAGEAIKLIEQGQWVKAIQKIESLNTTDNKLVVDERGVLRPLSAMKSALIASMPEEGRRTFIKLNAPAAQAKLVDTLAISDVAEQAKAFQAIVKDYALCDAAAQAALHLGDLRFEQGHFNDAAAAYRFATTHPATTADDSALLARRLSALARSGQWSAFDELAAYARFRHESASVKIAGQDIALRLFIAQLAEARQAKSATEPIDAPTRIAMPTASDYEYDRMLFDEHKLKQVELAAWNRGVRPIVDYVLAPVVAADRDRLFVLAMGQVTRLNPDTGTVLWSHGSDDETAKNLQSGIYHLPSGYHQSLTLYGDTLLASLPNKHDISQSHLIALDAATGQEKWNLVAALRRKNQSIVGKPLLVGDLLYFTTYATNQALALCTVNVHDGSSVGTVLLGKASKEVHMNAPPELSPRLAMGQSHLFVQTNNGALIAVEPRAMKIAWAYSQKIRPSGIAIMRQRGHPVAEPLARHTGEVVALNGLIVSKDTRTNQVVAMREHDAAVLWQAEVDPDATIVHYDNQRIYVLGKQLIALDPRTGGRIWWTPHPGNKAGKPVFTKDACLIAGNQRLCRVDLATGKLTDYREDLNQPGVLHIIGQQLIRLTHQNIAAMRLP